MSRKGMTIRQLAIRSGLGYATVHGYVTGSRGGTLPAHQNLLAIAQTLGVTIDELSGKKVPPPVPPDIQQIVQALERLSPADRAMIREMAERLKKGE